MIDFLNLQKSNARYNNELIEAAVELLKVDGISQAQN